MWIARSRRSPSAGSTSPRSASCDELVQSRDLVEAQRARELRRGLDRRPSGPSERDHHRGRQHDDASVRSAGRGDDPGEALLRLAHGRAGQAQRAPELEHERVQIAGPLGGQCTICISRVVLFRRRPPSSVTVTMSSIRTPKRPLQVDPGLDREAHPGLERVRLALDHVRRLVRGQADAVPGAVDEVLAVAGLGDHRARRPVDVLARRRPAAPPRSRPAGRGARCRAPRAPRRWARRRGWSGVVSEP